MRYLASLPLLLLVACAPTDGAAPSPAQVDTEAPPYALASCAVCDPEPSAISGDDDDDDLTEEPTPEPVPPVCPAVPTEDGVTLAEVSECAGISRPIDLVSEYLGTAQAWGDADGDGVLDLVTADPATLAILYLGQPGGTFIASKDWELPEIDLVGGATFVDYDNDGLRDLHLLRLGADVLLRNTGSGFEDVSVASGLDAADGMSQSAAWADYDGDGFLDAYVVAWICGDCVDPVTGQVSTFSDDSFFHNEGDGTFTDVSGLLPTLEMSGAGYAATWSDLDNDGDPDLLVANDKGYPGPPPVGGPLNRNAHFRNDGPGCGGWCFAEIGEESGFGLHMDGMGIAVADYDQDLDFDVLVSDSAPPRLFEQFGGSFIDASLAADTGTAVTVGEEEGWGLHWFDLQNDGCLDLFEAVGPSSRDPHDHLRTSDCEGMFVDASAVLEPRSPMICYGTATADYDADGRMDFVEGCDIAGHRLYRNLGSGEDNAWLQLRLFGGQGVNMDAVGARALLVDSKGRQHLQEVRIGGSVGSGHDLTLHFGLGEASVVSLTITWPDGAVDPLGAVSTGQRILRSRAASGP